MNDEQKQQLERLWAEQHFISQQPIAENKYLPLFIGFVTQDQPKELLNYFESQRPVFKKRADDFEKQLEAAEPRHLEALLDLATRAYRRPLSDKEKQQLLALYAEQRRRCRTTTRSSTLARVLVSPAFLFRIEKPPAGKEPGPVGDWELPRPSYFLWSSSPDDELRRLAAAEKLRDKCWPSSAHVEGRGPSLPSIRHSGCVRGFEDLKEKNELFPTFDESSARR